MSKPPAPRSIYAFVAGCAIGLFLATIGFALVLNSGAGGAAAGRMLRLAHALEPSHPVHLGLEEMARRVDTLSGGRLQLVIYHSGQLGDETSCLEQLQGGSLDITKVSASALEAFVPEMAVFSMPYVFRDHDHFWRVLESELGERMLQAGRSANVVGLSYYDAGARSFYTVKKPVLSPADLKGVTIRVQKSKTAMDMIEAMGGLPTPISWGELYTALQQSMVDGAENNPPSVQSSRHYEVAKHYALNEHTHTPDLVLISKATWDSLSEEHRKILYQAAHESTAYQRKLWKEKSDEAMAELEKGGMKIYRDIDKQPFIQAVEKMIRAHDGKPTGKLIEEIRSVS
jgi:tripartite ATP-independent transporter DctP family solute receptor